MTSPIGTTPTERRAPPRGFTLIELTLVLVILALAAAVVTPMLSAFARGRVDDDTAVRLLALMQYAHEQAINQGTPFRVQVDPSQRTYQVTEQQASQFVPVARSIGRLFMLPQGMAVSWQAPADIDSRNYVQFNPDGRHDVATLALTPARGQVLRITCDSVGEPYRILSPQANGSGS